MSEKIVGKPEVFQLSFEERAALIRALAMSIASLQRQRSRQNIPGGVRDALMHEETAMRSLQSRFVV